MNQNDFKYEAVTGRDDFKGFLNLPYERQLSEYFDKGVRPSELIIRYEFNDTHVSLEQILNDVEFTTTGFYPKPTTLFAFYYNIDTKKIISLYNKHNLVKDLMELQPFEWLKNGYETHQVQYDMFIDEVVVDILMGEITDVKGIFDHYFTEQEVWSIDWELYNEYLKTYYSMPISWIYEATTDANNAITALIEGKFDNFERIIMMALSIGEKIDPTWSVERMEEEYQNLKRKTHYDETEIIRPPRFNDGDDLPF